MMQDCAHSALAVTADLVILGGTGGLARKYLMPTLVEITAAGGLSPASRVLAVDRDPLARDAYRRQVFGDLHLDTIARQEGRIARTWPTFMQMLDYLSGDLTDTTTHRHLARLLCHPAGRRPTADRVSGGAPWTGRARRSTTG
jgi:glucose-6-phosphate 1-dehydrogenase